VQVDASGQMSRVDGHCRAGAALDLRFEMDTIVLLHNGPHPLDPRTTYAPPDVQLQAFASAPVGREDACRQRCPENARGYDNTERYCA
jgi:uncharacterized protein